MLEQQCVRCEQPIKPGQYVGCFGDVSQRHQAAPKTYYSKDSNGLCIAWKTDKTVMVPDGSGRTIHIAGASAKFVNGMYTSTDPEEQAFLDKVSYLVPQEVFEQHRLKPEIRAERAQTQLVEERRLRQKAEEELARLKARPPEPEAETAGVGADAGSGRSRRK